MSTVTVMIADGEELFRLGLRAALETHDGSAVVAEAAAADAVVDGLHSSGAEVLILDLDLPGGGLQIVRAIRESGSTVKILALSRHGEVEWVRAAAATGVHGFIGKGESPQHLLQAIRALQQGNSWMSFHLGSDLRALFGGDGLTKDLPEREAEVLQLMALGFTYKVIAERLGMSSKTVESYRSRICERLGLETRADLVRYCLETGVLQAALDPPPSS